MAQKMTKNQMRRAKKKEQKMAQTEVKQESPSETEATASNVDSNVPADAAIVVEPATKKERSLSPEIEDFGLGISENDPNFAIFQSVINRFSGADENQEAKDAETGEDKGKIYYSDDDEIPEEEEQQEQKLSKKKRKQQNKLSVAELKALSSKPDLVEWTDTSATEPRLLVHLKAYKNIVPVPNHWSLKREYLSSKRGVEKKPFSLPQFIKDTGIAEMRDAVLEKQNEASLKQKARERVQPKMGKLDIDYQKLYEAFFRHQTKPELTRFGEVYYEGKEYETNLKHLRPGELSPELKEALNMPPGAPPPWLINMQRFGPPPSYPALKIPGLNAPPPPGASWGFHPGGYGKPPVDEFNRPLYGGDIFGVLQPQVNTQTGEPVERNIWGELQPPEDESEEEDDDEEEEEEEEEGNEEDVGTQDFSGLETPGGVESTLPSEYAGDVSGDFDLRKQRRAADSDEPAQPRSAYTVVPERHIQAEGFFGGEKAYDIRSAQNAHLPVLGQDDENRKRKKPGDVDVAINPDALLAEDGLSKEELRRQYDASKKEEKGAWGFEEDLSDMIAQESRKRLKRDEERQASRKDRSFKF